MFATFGVSPQKVHMEIWLWILAWGFTVFVAVVVECGDRHRGRLVISFVNLPSRRRLQKEAAWPPTKKHGKISAISDRKSDHITGPPVSLYGEKSRGDEKVSSSFSFIFRGSI